MEIPRAVAETSITSAAAAGDTTATARRPAVISEKAHWFNRRIFGNPLSLFRQTEFGLGGVRSVTVLVSMLKTHPRRQSKNIRIRGIAIGAVRSSPLGIEKLGVKWKS